MSAKLNKEPMKKEPREMTVVEPQRFLAPFEDMERWFEEAFRRPFFGPSWLPRLKLPEIMGEISPTVDIFEDANDVVVKAEVPGIRKEDIELNVSEDTITISGENLSPDDDLGHPAGPNGGYQHIFIRGVSPHGDRVTPWVPATAANGCQVYGGAARTVISLRKNSAAQRWTR